METRLTGVAFSAGSLCFRIFTAPLLFFLGIVENTLSKFEPSEEEEEVEDPDQRFNFALAFANGQRQDVCVTGTSGTTDAKKMKLLLDINVLPDKKYEVVSARNLTARSERKSGWLPWHKWTEMLAYYVLKIIKIIREIIGETEQLLDSCKKSYRAVTVGSEGDRKRISPKKRISRSRVRYFKRYVANVKRILGLARPEGITFDPIEGVADTSLNGSLNASKLKAVEKRKHPTGSEDDSDFTEDESSDTAEDQGQKETANGGHDVSFSPDKKTCLNDRKKDYFEVDEDYKSAEDPDYVPEEAHDSSSDTDSEDEKKEDLEEEQRMLKEDLNRDIINGKH